MALNINTSNFINTQPQGSGNSTNVSGQVTLASDGAVVSVKGLDLSPGQTLSGQVVEIEGKDIKLLLSNNQTINAKLEGNISALLGQTMSFEVKNTENGQTSLRPLYTNLNSSPAVSNALTSAGLPHTENYAKMVSTMMDEGMPVNKNALYDMAKNLSNYPFANPETVVKLNKLGLQVNELTINQYENYKGLERQIVGDVETVAKGLTELMKDSLSDIASAPDEAVSVMQKTFQGKNLFSAFINAITGKNGTEDQLKTAEIKPDTLNQNINAEGIVTEEEAGTSVQNNVSGSDNILAGDNAENAVANALENNSENILDNNPDNNANVKITAESPFDTAKMVLEMIEMPEGDKTDVSNAGKDNGVNVAGNANEVGKPVTADLAYAAKELSSTIQKELAGLDNNVFKSIAESPVYNNEGQIQVNDRDIMAFAKAILNSDHNIPEKLTESTKQKLADLLSNSEFGKITKDALTKQILLKPEEAANAKNIEDVFEKITSQASKAIEILQSSGKDNPELMNAAKNINDNVSFMNELNHVASYVQLPLLMNGKSAHGDLYVYTKKKSIQNNDGNITALLHLDMENLGPMDIYVALSNGQKLNTQFYLKDESTIDFIAEHIDALNKRLTEKGYNTDIKFTQKDSSKGGLNMADEFLKDEPGKEGVVASKYSFDVRA